MSNKGYQLEHETEDFLLELAGQSRDTPMSDRCHRIPTSGAMRGDKGDVVSIGISFFPKQLLFECKRRKEKYKGGKSFTLPEAWLTKNEGEAAERDAYAIFLGAFTNGQEHRKFIVMNPDTFQQFLKIPLFKSSQDIQANKKGNFKIRKTDLDTHWNASLTNVLNLKGNSTWILFSYDYFVKLLHIQKEAFMNKI